MTRMIRPILLALLLVRSAGAEVEIVADVLEATPCDVVSFTAIGAPEGAVLEWEIAGPRIFANGFESGNLDAWTAVEQRLEKTVPGSNPFVWTVPISAARFGRSLPSANVACPSPITPTWMIRPPTRTLSMLPSRYSPPITSSTQSTPAVPVASLTASTNDRP